MKLNLFDSHVHTDNSPHGEHSATYICEQAAAGGVMGIAITDRYDCDMVESHQMNLRLRQSLFDIERNRLAFGQSLRIATGVELGQGHRHPEVARKLAEKARFDVVLGAVHTISPGQKINEINFNDPQVVVSQVLQGYFDQIMAMCRWGQFDVLAHLTAPVHIIWGGYRIPVDINEHREAVEEILREIIARGIALEINTMGLYQNLGQLLPQPDIIRWYYAMGGRLITLGSSARRVEHLAYGFDLAMDLLTGIGFTHFAFYKDRQAVLLKMI